MQAIRGKVEGLSPHARGNRQLYQRWAHCCGPIPACTGEPACRLIAGQWEGAYPRMHGGTPAVQSDFALPAGLSPHARGNRHGASPGSEYVGPIPACTGEPWGWQSHQRPARAYPRMHGGTICTWRPTRRRTGLSPHARGNHWSVASAGSSGGPIPACTGEPVWRGMLGRWSWAYPRMHGGTAVYAVRVVRRSGLSPHARGNRIRKILCALPRGPIPACTGEPKNRQLWAAKSRAYPRMHGGTVVLLRAMLTH